MCKRQNESPPAGWPSQTLFGAGNKKSHPQTEFEGATRKRAKRQEPIYGFMGGLPLQPSQKHTDSTHNAPVHRSIKGLVSQGRFVFKPANKGGFEDGPALRGLMRDSESPPILLGEYEIPQNEPISTLCSPPFDSRAVSQLVFWLSVNY